MAGTSTDMPPLPAGHATRQPTLDDAQLVFELFATVEQHRLGEVQVELEDVRADWRRPNYDIARDGVFVLDAAGHAVGYAEVFVARGEVCVLPEREGCGIGTWLAAWIERRAREVGAGYVRQVVASTSLASIELLERAGYERSDTAWELEIDLPARVERPAATSHVDVREFRPGVDDQDAFEVVEAAFSAWPNREPNTFDGWRTLTVEREGFEPHLLLAAWDQDELVGVAFCIDDPAGGSIWIQQLAVRPDRQGGGIGTLLLAECFERFAAGGRTKVGLSTDSRTGALGLYERVGMRVIRDYAGFVRTFD